jgi:hypothetical protein
MQYSMYLYKRVVQWSVVNAASTYQVNQVRYILDASIQQKTTSGRCRLRDLLRPVPWAALAASFSVGLVPHCPASLPGMS